jgi:hypothetical protein
MAGCWPIARQPNIEITRNIERGQSCHFMTFPLSRQFRAPRYSLLSEPLEVECFATGKIGQTRLNGEGYPLTGKRLKNPPKTGAVLGTRARNRTLNFYFPLAYWVTVRVQLFSARARFGSETAHWTRMT